LSLLQGKHCSTRKYRGPSEECDADSHFRFAAVEVVFIGTVPSTNIPGLTHGAIAGISISSGVIALTILLTVTAHLYKQKTRRDKERRHREAAERVEKLKRPSPANTSSWPSESMA